MMVSLRDFFLINDQIPRSNDQSKCRSATLFFPRIHWALAIVFWSLTLPTSSAASASAAAREAAAETRTIVRGRTHAAGAGSGEM